MSNWKEFRYLTAQSILIKLGILHYPVNIEYILYKLDISAFSDDKVTKTKVIWKENNPIILYNGNLSEVDKRLWISQAIGYILNYNHLVPLEDFDKKENENLRYKSIIFAVNLLVPIPLLSAATFSNVSKISDLARLFYVSYSVMKARLNSLGMENFYCHE
jgi:Zn-dependent peptidase ImmA (M78 family)